MPNLLIPDVVIDPDLGESYTILRSQGDYIAGGFTDQKTSIKAWGVVSVIRPKDLEMVPEGDRVTEGRCFYAQQALYTTRVNPDGSKGISDILIWNGVQYRILTVFDYSQRGYWKAIATRMIGD